MQILDIGIGKNPYFLRFDLDCEADRYVGLDSCTTCVDANRLKARSPRSGLRAPLTQEFLVANATELPFEHHSFDIAVLSNVLSAPVHKKWAAEDPAHLVSGFGEKDRFYTERKKIISEALRVLRPGGKLMIYTDIIIYGTHAYETLLKELAIDPRVRFRSLPEEASRIDALNREKVNSGRCCYCFMADVLPESAVYEVAKLY